MNRKNFLKAGIFGILAVILPQSLQATKEELFYELSDPIPVKSGVLYIKNVIPRQIRCGGQPIDLKFMEDIFPMRKYND